MMAASIDVTARCRYTRPMRIPLALPLMLVTACRDDPAVVLDQARTALATRDEAAFIALCDPKSAELLRAAPEVVRQSGRKWQLFHEGRPTPRLLPEGEVVDVVEQGQRAVVTLRTKKPNGQVPMRLVDGEWRLDLLTMPQFTDAVTPRR